jgi:isopenicillin N synthase-like dioxygenase
MSIAADLLNNGYSIHKLPEVAARQMMDTKRAAVDFFSQLRPVKDSEFFKGEHIGYRPIGGEYVGTPDQWDINESLNYSRMAAERVREWSVAREFYCKAKKLLPLFDGIVQAALQEFRAYYHSTHDVPATMDASWIQVNFYRRKIADQIARNLMQGKHEDGHLITLWNAEDHGMEFFPYGPEGTPQPLSLNANELLIMPGTLMTKATGGDVKPLYHQVRRHDAVEERLAIMYFTNPDPAAAFLPFPLASPQVDLSEVVRSDKLLIRPGRPDLEIIHE